MKEQVLPVPVGLVDRLAAMEVRVDGWSVAGRSLETASGWTRRTSVVVLAGGGHEGRGEDVTYAGPDHDDLQAGRVDLEALSGARTLGETWAVLDGLELFPAEPGEARSRRYRRWALESALLDLALAQAGTDLARVLGRAPAPLAFGASLSLDGDPDGPGFARLDELRRRLRRVRVKLDWAPGWDAATLARLAALDVVDVVDLKGHYHGDFRGPEPDGDAYRAVAEALPGAWLEDPWLGAGLAGPWSGPTWEALQPVVGRVTWDAPLGNLGDLTGLPVVPRCVNLKPSRFGTLAELLAVLEHCHARGIGAYVGGQFELDVGRRQLQLLAALFCPGGPNDCAPAAYNGAGLPAELPGSPLDVDRTAFGVA